MRKYWPYFKGDSKKYIKRKFIKNKMEKDESQVGGNSRGSNPNKKQFNMKILKYISRAVLKYTKILNV